MYKITQENYRMLNRERIYTGRLKYKRELKNRLLKLMEIEQMNVDLRCTEICKHLSAS